MDHNLIDFFCPIVFVETLDKCFKNVCELDIVFNFNKVLIKVSPTSCFIEIKLLQISWRIFNLNQMSAVA